MKVATSKPNTFKIGAEIEKLAQGTEFSHVLIVDGDLVYQASHGLVNCMYIDNFLAENIIINEYEVPDSEVDMIFVKKQLGKKYGYQELLSIAMNYLFGIKQFIRDDGNKTFICSEFVGKALKLDWVDDSTTPLEIDQYLKTLAQNS